MTVHELALLLEIDGINGEAYCLTGGLPNEAYAIDAGDGLWCTYYSERGERTGIQWFHDESTACNHLRTMLLADPTTRRSSSA